MSSPQQTPSEFPLDLEDLPSLRILLAEDIGINQKVALQILDRLGYQADIASNGIEVLEALHRQLYDVILMDVQMPEMDGLEATRKIRNGAWDSMVQKSGLRDQPYIIAMTANALQGDRQVCLSAGMDDYLSKPIRVDELVDALKRAYAILRKDQSPEEVSLDQKTPPVTGVINEAVFQEFQKSVGMKNQKALAELIEDYMEESCDLMTSLKNAFTERHLENLRRAAHSLKSSSMLFGAMRLADLCKEMEFNANADHFDEDTSLLERIEEEFMAANLALERINKKLISGQGELFL